MNLTKRQSLFKHIEVTRFLTFKPGQNEGPIMLFFIYF